MKSKQLSILLLAFAICSRSAGAALIAQYTFDNTSNLGADSQNFANGTIGTSTSSTLVSFNDPERGSVIQMGGGASNYIYSSIGTLPAGGFTVTAWVKSSSWSNNRGIFQIQNGAGTTVASAGNEKIIAGWVNTSGLPWGRLVQSGGGQASLPTSIASPTLLTTGPSATWHHLAYRGNGTTYEVFIDGSNVGTGSVAYNGTINPHSTLIIGRQGNEAWAGLLDDVRVYNNALSNTEIRAIAAVPEPSVSLLSALSVMIFLRRRR